MNSSNRSHSHVIGMWLMVGVAFVFASHDAISKTLILALPVMFVAWARYLIHTLIVTSVIVREKRKNAFHTQRPWLHALRAVFLLGDSLTFLFGLTQVPLLNQPHWCFWLRRSSRFFRRCCSASARTVCSGCR